MTRQAVPAFLLALAASLLGPGAANGPASAEPQGPVATVEATREVPVPRLSLPPRGLRGHALWDSWHRLAPFGYRQQELFVSGTATSPDGTREPYTTRVIVFRPRTDERFNGTVLLDWTNVSAQFENAVDSMEAREHLLRKGYAYVHVSAQQAGLCCTPLTPKVWDPVRYAAIDHPGDAYATDIFSQVAKAMRVTRPGGPDPMRGLRVRRVLAAGQSQSGGKMYEYIDTRQSADRVVDGFLIHGWPVPLPGRSPSKHFEAPLTVPVIHLLSDWEAMPAPPPSDPRYRLMEVAATAHADYFIGYQSIFGNGPRQAGRPPVDRAGYDEVIEAAGNYGQLPTPLHGACTAAGASMPMHYTTSTAIHLLDRWVRTGKAPRRMPRFTFENGRLAKDEHGNARGGVRLPPAEVPVAGYQTTVCGLGGITVPFTDLQVRELYPTFDTYQHLMRRAADRAVRQGWLLPADARDQLRRACSVRDRYPAGSRGTCRPYDPPPFDSAAR